MPFFGLSEQSCAKNSLPTKDTKHSQIYIHVANRISHSTREWVPLIEKPHKDFSAAFFFGRCGDERDSNKASTELLALSLPLIP